MSFVNSVVLDGNQYLVSEAVNNGGNVNSSKEFDSIYNKISKDLSYDEIFYLASAETGVDVNLLKAVAEAESGCRADVTSSCGAMGVMQLMPATAKSYGVEDPYNAYDNIMGGARLLADLLERYDGNVTLSLASYNAGSGNVSKYGGVPPFKETTNYIAKINKLLGGALDNDSTTIEGSKPTNLSGASNSAISAYNYANVTSTKKSTEPSENYIVVPETARTDNSSNMAESAVTITKSLSQIALELLENESEDTSVSSELVSKANELMEEKIAWAESKVTDKVNPDADVFETINPYVLSGTQGINNLLRSNLRGLYEAQAAAVSPLIAQIKEI